MNKKERGQAFILVLILLAIGAMTVVPLLQFAASSSQNNQIVTQRLQNLYAAEGAQEFVMWKLVHTDYVTSFTYDGQVDNFTVDVCGNPVAATVVMRAVPSWHGVVLATNDRIKPTKTVSPTTNDGTTQTYTYTIRLEQISDNTEEGLDAIYDILPDAFSNTNQYVTGSSKFSIDGGSFVDIADPLKEVINGQLRLRWPASGSFTSPTRDFHAEQVKQLQFEVTGAMGPNTTNYNWVVLKPWNTLSGPQCPIVRGTGASPKNGNLQVVKVADKSFIPPNQTTPVNYIISIKNIEGNTDQIQQIDDYLPSGFSYVNGSTGGITTNNPTATQETINGTQRWHLKWTFSPAKSIAAGVTLYLSFTANATQTASGSYYNEVTVTPNNNVPGPFSSLGVTKPQYNSAYSWNSSPVLVPAYDSRTEAGDVTVDANLGLKIGGVSVFSFQIR